MMLSFGGAAEGPLSGSPPAMGSDPVQQAPETVTSSGDDAMSHRPSVPIRRTRGLLPRSTVTGLLRAGGAALLLVTASPALAAPAAAPGARSAPSQPEPGTACPIPGRVTAADGSLRGFAPSPRNFYLEVDGKEVPAEIYHIDTTALLMISPKFATPVLLKATTVAAVPLAMLEKKPDGTIDVRREAVLRPLGPYRATFDTVTFSIGGHSQALRMRPPLDFLRAPEPGSPHGLR
jgi:hypothetical protein